QRAHLCVDSFVAFKYAAGASVTFSERRIESMKNTIRLASPILSGVLFLAVASISASATENEKSTPSRTTAEKHEPVGTEKGPVRIENPISDPRSPADTELLDSSTST